LDGLVLEASMGGTRANWNPDSFEEGRKKILTTEILSYGVMHQPWIFRKISVGVAFFLLMAQAPSSKLSALPRPPVFEIGFEPTPLALFGHGWPNLRQRRGPAWSLSDQKMKSNNALAARVAAEFNAVISRRKVS
jgi:hypothetical protein